jgi:GcrA cell cycle regulator
MTTERAYGLFDWNDSNVALLLQLWDEGKSASQIATQMGAGSRSTIIGKIHRLRQGGSPARDCALMRRPPKIKPKRIRTHPFKANAKAVNPEPAAIVDLPPDQPTNPVMLLHLRADQCRWPCRGVGADTVFCGGQAIDGKSYCPRHYRQAHQKRSAE